MRVVYVGLAAALVLFVVTQFFLAGFSVLDPEPVVESFETHRVAGHLTVLVVILVTIAAAVARAPGRLIGLTALVCGLVLLQLVFGTLTAGETPDFGGRFIFALHAVNAAAILLGSIHVLRGAVAHMKSGRTAVPAGTKG